MSPSYDSDAEMPDIMSQGVIIAGPKPGHLQSTNPDLEGPPSSADEYDDNDGDDENDENYNMVTSDGEEAANANREMSADEYETNNKGYTQTVEPVPTNRHVYKKPVTTILDRDDTILLEMKNAGKSDKDVARALAGHGTFYAEKSIATRYRRIIDKQQKHQDEMFKAGQAWSVDEDMALLQAHTDAQDVMKSDVERIFKDRFQYISKSLRKILQTSNISPDACRTRLHDLLHPYPEMDAESRRVFEELVPAPAREMYLNQLERQLERDAEYQKTVLEDIRKDLREHRRMLAAEREERDWGDF